MLRGCHAGERTDGRGGNRGWSDRLDLAFPLRLALLDVAQLVVPILVRLWRTAGDLLGRWVALADRGSIGQLVQDVGLIVLADIGPLGVRVVLRQLVNLG